MDRFQKEIKVLEHQHVHIVDKWDICSTVVHLLRVEVMNVHQHVFPTTTIVVFNVFVLEIQAMNPSIGHTTVLVNY